MLKKSQSNDYAKYDGQHWVLRGKLEERGKGKACPNKSSGQVVAEKINHNTNSIPQAVKYCLEVNAKLSDLFFPAAERFTDVVDEEHKYFARSFDK